MIAVDENSDELAVPLRVLARGKIRHRTISAVPFWWRDAPPATGSQELPPATADVLVIGSGFTGLSAALVLARAGRDVVVVDANVPGYGASTRNGGQVGSGNQKFRVKTLIGMVGERKAVALLREGVEMLDGIEALIRDEKIDCAFVRCGRFRGAMRPQHYEAMARDMEDLKRYAGVESFVVPRDEQSREIGTELFYGGSVLPMDASLHPGAYHAGLMARVLEAGGRVHGNMAVRAIDSERQGHVVRFKDRIIRARDVLVATNGYTNGVGAYFRKRIVPVISAQIATGPIAPQLLDTLMPKRRVYGNTNRVFFYFRCAPGENRLIWGGRAAHVAPEDKHRRLRASGARPVARVSEPWRRAGEPRVERHHRLYLRRISSSRSRADRRVLRHGLLRYGRVARHPFWPQDRAADARQAGGPLGIRRSRLSEPPVARIGAARRAALRRLVPHSRCSRILIAPGRR